MTQYRYHIDIRVNLTLLELLIVPAKHPQPLGPSGDRTVGNTLTGIITTCRILD